MSSEFVPFNSRIFLITTLNFRYEGTLHSLDRKDNSLTLTNVRSFGSVEAPLAIPPVYEYILFKAADITFIEVREPVVYLNQVNQYTGYNSYLLLPFFQWNQGNATPAGTASDPKALTTMNLSLKDSDLDVRAIGLSDINESEMDTVEIKGNLSMASNTIPRPDGTHPPSSQHILSKSVPVIKKPQQQQYHYHHHKQDQIYKPINSSSAPQENTTIPNNPNPSTTATPTTEGTKPPSDQILPKKPNDEASGSKSSLDNSFRGGQRFNRGRPTNLIYRPKVSDPSIDTSEITTTTTNNNGDQSSSLHEKPCEDRISIITLTPSSDSFQDNNNPSSAKGKKHQRK